LTVPRWRFDLAWPLQKVAAEVDGGIFSRGRHVRGVGFEKDAEKRNAVVIAGWRVLHFTPRHIKSGMAVREIEALLKAIHHDDPLRLQPRGHKSGNTT